MNYKVIIIDLDNTLIDFDTMEVKSLTESLEAFDVTVDKDMISDYIQINQGLWENLEKGEYTKAEILVKRFERFFKQYDLSLSPEEMNRSYLSNMANHVHMLDGAQALLDHVKGKAHIICMTNGVQSAQHTKMEKAKLYPYFDHVIVSDVVGVHKPDVGIFNHMITLIGDHQKEDMIIIGDSLTSDIKGGNNFGIKTVWYNPKSKVNVQNEPVDYEIKSLTELMDIL